MSKPNTTDDSRPFVGHVERITDGAIAGWYWTPGNPEFRETIDIYIDGQLRHSLVADELREDLRRAGIGDGAHGFTLIPFEFNPKQKLSIIARASKTALNIADIEYRTFEPTSSEPAFEPSPGSPLPENSTNFKPDPNFAHGSIPDKESINDSGEGISVRVTADFLITGHISLKGRITKQALVSLSEAGTLIATSIPDKPMAALKKSL